MKKVISLLFCLLLSFSLAQGQIVPLEYWDFESDSSGTDLNDLSNSGSLGSSWNFNTPEDLTNGSGQFVIGSGAGVYTRKLPDGANEAGTTNLYASPLTTGKYLFEVTFAGWTADAASVGDTWNFKIQDSTGANVANIIWQVDTASTTRLRASTIANAGATQYFRQYNSTGLTQSTAVTLAIEFDFDNDTVRYLLDGVEEFSATDFSGDGISGWVYSKGGAWTSTETSLTLESMGLSQVVPEPSTYALVTSLCVLAFLVVRRRRK
ncbi:PEP-CTERM sorting domain-containing protein [Puniceicoccales bacterium CK1056]|uniref:PEP-CTERM sorting domain-containing protein n=1 Tax=Oceanipulchritudo coccoides TaxID=2706888 RepID=A0A6B2M518_9BACT|nr:PEP-CTERM sorting domain-containing protein [Oceanipulchritudo coccoides]NDV63184.1 PEP-CTERM sorting domain-containing protein [Oceanipulchritudo coccoides]